ncbi:MAG: Secretion system C-terminal sorting domain [Bacteroidota bacterium]|jgi:hypothetical protein
MKKTFLAAFILAFAAHICWAQVFPFVDDFSTHTNFSLVKAPWKTKNFNVYARGTGSPASFCAQTGLSTFGRFDSLITPTLGIVPANTVLSFNYRIVQYLGGTPLATTLVANDKFNVEISTNGGASWTILSALTPAADVSFTNKSIPLSAYTGQNVKIRFYCERATSATNDYTFHLDDFAVQVATTTENRAVKENNLIVFPNPVNNELNIKIVNFTGNAIVQLIDLAGRLVATKSLQFTDGTATQLLANEFRANGFSAKNLPQGVYFLIVKTETDYFTQKVAFF